MCRAENPHGTFHALAFHSPTAYFICRRQISLRSRKSLLRSLLNRNRDRNSHTNHGVVTCADETHHLYIPKEAKPILTIKLRIFTELNTSLGCVPAPIMIQLSFKMSSTFRIFLWSILQLLTSFYHLWAVRAFSVIQASHFIKILFELFHYWRGRNDL